MPCNKHNLSIRAEPRLRLAENMHHGNPQRLSPGSLTRFSKTKRKLFFSYFTISCLVFVLAVFLFPVATQAQPVTDEGMADIQTATGWASTDLITIIGRILQIVIG
ncbi:hypothetical protein KKD19_01275, partial [Patescibacteria group bacterium]|nr:hypothetical protein [Patescibacteria group bacterium]MBU4511864.1 hypothetical protein [Patescibacteria group bacterium]